jgi:hypothetical protein
MNRIENILPTLALGGTTIFSTAVGYSREPVKRNKDSKSPPISHQRIHGITFFVWLFKLDVAHHFRFND